MLTATLQIMIRITLDSYVQTAFKVTLIHFILPCILNKSIWFKLQPLQINLICQDNQNEG